MARFVRPSGERGVVHLMASSSIVAMLDVLERQGPLSMVSVSPQRVAALLAAGPTARSTRAERRAQQP
ncbi:hypothetical protein [Eleftheria terrae]|uniref:hypothetical protein n=1 Tax=Eleftheria terrae TaxID=1597781 RepID=UPI00263B0BDA|nr:hypothetical protein [Eleftheria terrae]